MNWRVVYDVDYYLWIFVYVEYNSRGSKEQNAMGMKTKHVFSVRRVEGICCKLDHIHLLHACKWLPQCSC